MQFRLLARAPYLALLFLTMVLSGCKDNRPNYQNAREAFQRLYPGVEIIDIRISEDEVIARSFRFRYRKTSGSTENEITIQFMEDAKSGFWRPVPDPPKDLP